MSFYVCELCQYTTMVKGRYRNHLLTTKHSNNKLTSELNEFQTQIHFMKLNLDLHKRQLDEQDEIIKRNDIFINKLQQLTKTEE